MHPKTKIALEHLAVMQHITRLQNMNENYDTSTEKVLNSIEMIADADVRMRSMYKGENMGLPARPVMSQSQSNNTNTQQAGRSSVKERLQAQKIAELENENAQLKQAVSVFDDRKVEIYERVNGLRQTLEAQFLKVTEEIYDGFFPGA